MRPQQVQPPQAVQVSLGQQPVSGQMTVSQPMAMQPQLAALPTSQPFAGNVMANIEFRRGGGGRPARPSQPLYQPPPYQS